MTIAEELADHVEGYRKRMTEDEFESWALRTRARAEWVEGEVIVMSPVNYDHDTILQWLGALINFHAAKHHLGQVHGPEYAMRLKQRRRLPDLFFLAKGREEMFTKNYLEGAPDFIVEVVSPDAKSRDRQDKYLEYEASGVREYWIIDPLSREAEFYESRNSKFVTLAIIEGVVRSAALAGFWLKVEWLWQQPLPNVFETAKIIGIV